MIPNNFKHRIMFEFLYDFTRGKYLFSIFLLYLFLILFNNVKDSHVLYSFMVFYLLLLVQGFFINTGLKKSFARYRKFLRLKRKRANNFGYTSKKNQ